ncbi:hypothetical protein EDB83DRAFT_2416051 [Lactarius deliciosus]|nr:hypothetical protein EDB83DRAFT_2416051 [Lactarius deliciosus]
MILSLLCFCATSISRISIAGYGCLSHLCRFFLMTAHSIPHFYCQRRWLRLIVDTSHFHLLPSQPLTLRSLWARVCLLWSPPQPDPTALGLG